MKQKKKKGMIKNFFFIKEKTGKIFVGYTINNFNVNIHKSNCRYET